jgi:hypothetical protein
MNCPICEQVRSRCSHVVGKYNVLYDWMYYTQPSPRAQSEATYVYAMSRIVLSLDWLGLARRGED